jgi:dTDP-4-dehydrorhamnose reductase
VWENALFSNGFQSSALRVLITGGTGLLGVNWAAAMRGEHEIWLGTHRRRVSLRGVRSVALDCTAASAVDDALARLRPDLVVNAAGLADVDRCERDPAQAQALNATLAAVVAAACAARKVRLVQISTDHLFAGDAPCRAESDPPAPVNAYARSKLEAEREVAARCPAALIVRTNFFGFGHAFRKSLSDWILDGLRHGRPLDMFVDAHFTPILADELARAVHELVEGGAAGILNVCGDERVSKFEFARRLAATFDLPVGLVRPGALGAARLAAPRPPDLSLSNALGRERLGRPLGGVDVHLAALREQEDSGRAREQARAVSGPA